MEPRTVTSDPWFHRHPVVRPTRRLVCFPHAGGTATAYLGWSARLPVGVELLAVQYPGRQNRLGDPCIVSMKELADAVTRAILPYLDTPVALFGHSMGAAVGYEVAIRLERAGQAVDRLLVSALGAGARPICPQARLDDTALLARLRELAAPEAEAYSYAELRELLMPPLRADYRLLSAYRPSATPVKLRAPITAYGGANDTAWPPETLAAWANFTAAACETSIFPGGHFYLREHEAALVHHLSSRLTVPER